VGNLDKHPIEACTKIGIEAVSVTCVNNGGNSEPAEGIPHQLQQLEILEFSSTVTSENLVGRGKACVGGEDDPDWCIESSDIYAAIEQQLPEPGDPNWPCQNHNWYISPEETAVEQALVYFQAYYDTDADEFPDTFADGECRRYTRVVDEDGCRYDWMTVDESECIAADLLCYPPYPTVP
jgi:hypothetical protein